MNKIFASAFFALSLGTFTAPTAQAAQPTQCGLPDPSGYCLKVELAAAPTRTQWTPPGPIMFERRDAGRTNYAVYDTSHASNRALPRARINRNYYGDDASGVTGY